MLEMLRPNQCVARVDQIDLEKLRALGIRALLLDLDNTLVPWGRTEMPTAVRQWLGRAKQLGFSLCITSNSLAGRVAQMGESLSVPYIPSATKPRKSAFRRALSALGATAAETAVIGDQLFTDVLGGNRMSLHTILVNPVSSHELFATRIARRVERLIIRHMGRRGWLTADQVASRLTHLDSPAANTAGNT